jgi:hypothetical protein
VSESRRYEVSEIGDLGDVHSFGTDDRERAEKTVAITRGAEAPTYDSGKWQLFAVTQPSSELPGIFRTAIVEQTACPVAEDVNAREWCNQDWCADCSSVGAVGSLQHHLSGGEGLLRKSEAVET